MPTMTTGGFAKILAPGLRKVFFDSYKDWPEEYSAIANVGNTERAYEEDLIMAGGGVLERKTEGREISFDTFVEGPSKKHYPVTFALGFIVTHEMYKDDLYNIMKKMTKQLARAARITVDIEFGLFLDDIFTGTYYTGADGNPLCYSTGHPLSGTGGVYKNAPTVGADLGVSSLRAASERVERMVDERGLPVMMQPKLLVVTPTYKWIAHEILKADKAPYTNENQPNSTQQLMDLTYTVNHYMSDSDQWNLFAQKGEHDVHVWWREKTIFDASDDFRAKCALVSAYQRFAIGFTDWRGADGSPGGT